MLEGGGWSKGLGWGIGRNGSDAGAGVGVTSNLSEEAIGLKALKQTSIASRVRIDINELELRCCESGVVI